MGKIVGDTETDREKINLQRERESETIVLWEECTLLTI